MGGGLLQLVAYGAQDAYLSGNPQITFWKGLYKRHTNFAMEPFRINFTGQPNWGTKQSATIGRHADLLYSTYVEVVMPAGTFNCDQGRLGYNLIKYAELDIGGQLIDRLYGEWLYLWDTLSNNYAASAKTWDMVNAGRAAGSIAFSGVVSCNATTGRAVHPDVVYIPLTFFFTRNPAAALPLISLQYHEVKINLLWNSQEFLKGDFTSASNLPGPVQAAIYIDYIYLDVEERRRMAQQSHEYLIEQVQFNEDKGMTSANARIDLTFNHPVKELVWVCQPASFTDCSLSRQFGQNRLLPFTYVNPSSVTTSPVYEQRLQINGQDRLDTRYGDYFHKVQPYQHHSGGGVAVTGPTTTPLTGWTQQNGIYMYSFALRPEEHQPSGTCNFSRIDTATLVLTMDGTVVIDEDRAWNVRVYATNYNILRIMSGMAGLAYSN